MDQDFLTVEWRYVGIIYFSIGEGEDGDGPDDDEDEENDE